MFNPLNKRNMGTTPNNQSAQQQANGAALVAMPKNISDNVLARVTELEQAGELVLPTGYTAGNALKMAWLNLQNVRDRNNRPALEVCKQASICNALLEMVIKGLSVAKKQCYFIVAGDQLTCREDYRGKLMRAKRDTEVADVNAQVVYKDDNFVYTVDDKGRYQLVKHETKLENINLSAIVGAYAVVITKDGDRWIEVMTMDQIRKSWQQGAAKGNSGAHNNFTDQMCKKTVISRACKIALGAAVEEADEPDTAAMQREAAQHGQQAVSVDYVEVKEEALPVVDTETGELLEAADNGTQAAQPADNASQPANLFDNMGGEHHPAGAGSRKCPIA